MRPEALYLTDILEAVDAVHEYFAVSWAIVWVTVTRDVPDLRQKVTRILAEEYVDG